MNKSKNAPIHFSVITVFKQLYEPFLATSLVARAIESNKIAVAVESFFSVVNPKERIDAPPFGHAAGMLIKPTVVEKIIEKQEQLYGPAFKIFFSPQGKIINQRILEQLAEIAHERGHLFLLPARYEGMDSRVEEEYADLLVSAGNFVLMAGDLPAMMLLEGVIRLLPGVVGKEASIEHESFNGPFLDYPIFTAPVVWKGHRVPEVMRSGNHAAQNSWCYEQSITKTIKLHFSWLRAQLLTKQQKNEIARALPEHYVVLMHSQVYIGSDHQVGTTSVTTIDIHDIARSCRTYGIVHFFIVTPLIDQQKIVQKLLDFWSSEQGVGYNPNRHDALDRVSVVSSLEQVMSVIEKTTTKKPLIITTSARLVSQKNILYYNQQQTVFMHMQPVLLIFGTGRGLVDELINKSDFTLAPVHSFTEFNHLSVRSAVAIVLDRWLGINENVDYI